MVILSWTGSGARREPQWGQQRSSRGRAWWQARWNRWGWLFRLLRHM